MTIYIALLKGINVGGNNIIKMEELRKYLTELDLHNVQTYIQSGNILFKSDESRAVLKDRIEKMIQERFKLNIAVVLRTSEEWTLILERFASSNVLREKSNLMNVGDNQYIAFMNQTAPQEIIEKIEAFNSDRDFCLFSNQEVYLLFCDSIRSSNVVYHLQKLVPETTTRNWKTSTKLLQLANAMK